MQGVHYQPLAGRIAVRWGSNLQGKAGPSAVFNHETNTYQVLKIAIETFKWLNRTGKALQEFQVLQKKSNRKQVSIPFYWKRPCATEGGMAPDPLYLQFLTRISFTHHRGW